MRASVRDAVRQLDQRGLVKRYRDKIEDHPELIIDRVREIIGRDVPPDLADLYRERIYYIGEFDAYAPTWNDYVGWHGTDEYVSSFLHLNVIPIFGDGCGNRWVLDLTPGVEVPAVYFLDKLNITDDLDFAAGSSLGAFLLLLGDHDRAIEEGWPEQWELNIDPDIDSCPRAPAIWRADEEALNTPWRSAPR